MMLNLRGRLRSSPRSNPTPRRKAICLVPDVKNWKRWWSMKLIILTVVFQTAAITYISLPYTFTQYFPDWFKAILAWGALMTAIGAGVTRVIQQPGLDIPTISDIENQHRNW